MFHLWSVRVRARTCSVSACCFHADEASDVTFNLKDFKAMLWLCENLNSDVMIRVAGTGMPLVVEPHFHGARVSRAEGGLVLHSSQQHCNRQAALDYQTTASAGP